MNIFLYLQIVQFSHVYWRSRLNKVWLKTVFSILVKILFRKYISLVEIEPS